MIEYPMLRPRAIHGTNGLRAERRLYSRWRASQEEYEILLSTASLFSSGRKVWIMLLIYKIIACFSTRSEAD